ncbi:hypothetical protein [Muricoccus aerilatus]|uniref:hypothetical protein n=1 Tax=Muricoccus aerilatus TaxID=452982 RepID=UPI000B2619D5|nr:hypothetical protein [Roseomonas aerilata]
MEDFDTPFGFAGPPGELTERLKGAAVLGFAGGMISLGCLALLHFVAYLVGR